MNHHYRSCSEQLQPTQANHHHNQQSVIATTANPNRLTNNNNQIPELQRQDSFVRVYSDSQSSLDRLFNPHNIQATVPLRNRNLPASFFNPAWQLQQPLNIDNNNSTSNNHINQQQLHTRSVSLFQPASQHQLNQEQTNPTTNGNGSFSNSNSNLATMQQQSQPQPQPQPQQQPQQRHHHHNVHMRSRSTIAPMTSGAMTQPAASQLQQPVNQQQTHRLQAPAFTTNGAYFPPENAEPSHQSTPMDHCNHQQPQSPSYFTPYAPYDPSLSTSSGSLNPSSSLATASSSSSSNENNSLLGVSNSIDSAMPLDAGQTADIKPWIQTQPQQNIYFGYH